MNIATLSPNPSRAAAALPEQLEQNLNRTEAQKVADVGRQFEAVLLRQILTDATKNMFSNGEGQASSTNGIYQDMVTNSLADSMSRSGGLGMAQVLAKQLQHECKTAPASPTGTAKV